MMAQIIDEVLEYATRKPGRAAGWILGTAAGILVAYWTTSGYFGEEAKTFLALGVLFGAIVLSARHMSRRAKTEEFAATETRAEIAVNDALFKYRSGQPLTAEDVAALRLRREGRIS